MNDQKEQLLLDPMKALEMTRLCAAAMGYTNIKLIGGFNTVSAIEIMPGSWVYDPLNDDAQVMALVKDDPLHVIPAMAAHALDRSVPFDLNRAIVECVAKMQRGRP